METCRSTSQQQEWNSRSLHVSAHVVASVNAGAKVAYAPSGIKGGKRAARSLYGGIVNTLGVSALNVNHLVQYILDLGADMPRRSRPPHPLTAVFAALRISNRFKNCFGNSKEMTLRSWYLMHLEGDNILGRVNSHRLGEELASVTYSFATGPAADIFGTSFTEIPDAL